MPSNSSDLDFLSFLPRYLRRDPIMAIHPGERVMVGPFCFESDLTCNTTFIGILTNYRIVVKQASTADPTIMGTSTPEVKYAWLNELKFIEIGRRYGVKVGKRLQLQGKFHYLVGGEDVEQEGVAAGNISEGIGLHYKTFDTLYEDLCKALHELACAPENPNPYFSLRISGRLRNLSTVSIANKNYQAFRHSLRVQWSQKKRPFVVFGAIGGVGLVGLGMGIHALSTIPSLWAGISSPLLTSTVPQLEDNCWTTSHDFPGERMMYKFNCKKVSHGASGEGEELIFKWNGQTAENGVVTHSAGVMGTEIKYKLLRDGTAIAIEHGEERRGGWLYHTHLGRVYHQLTFYDPVCGIMREEWIPKTISIS